MKNRWFLWLVAATIGTAMAFPPLISAAEKKAEEKMAPEKKAEVKAKSATGEVVSVDAKAGMLAVKVKDKEMSFTAETKAAKEALEKVKVKDMVTVSYTEKEGKMVASSIEATKAEKKPEKKMEEKKEKK